MYIIYISGAATYVCMYLALGEDGVVHVQLPRLVHRQHLAAGEEDDLCCILYHMDGVDRVGLIGLVGVGLIGLLGRSGWFGGRVLRPRGV